MGRKAIKARDRRGSTLTLKKNFALVGETGLGVALYILRHHGRRISAGQRASEGVTRMDYPVWAGAFVQDPRLAFKALRLTCP